MTQSYDSQCLDDPEFQSLLVGCLESLQRGETIDRNALVKDFPKFSEEIGQFLNDRELLEQVASDFGDVPPSRVAISAYANTMDSASGPKDFSLGETVQYIGEYEILEEIARGGMGVVFKARQQKLGRTVALKMILSGRLADSDDVERFYREARAAGQLTHTNIVPVHEVGEHDGRHYFTMDYVEGSSLAEIIRDETLSPQKAAELVRSIAHAIQYAHEQGTVHRDLKPANVLLDSSAQPKVTDFGLAKMLGSSDDETRVELTASGQVLGTPSYMSPEQASGKQELVGPASDIYSLGAILYACLTGRAPFVADSPVDTLLQVMNKEPVSPHVLNPSVPKDLETICLKCLSKEPHRRYGTARSLADDLENHLAGKPISARPVTRIERTWRWAARNPVVASLITMVAICLFAGACISSYFSIEARERANQERLAKEREAELRIETEQLASDLQESLNLESELRSKAQREQQLAQDAEQRAKQAQAEESIQRKLAEEQKKLAVGLRYGWTHVIDADQGDLLWAKKAPNNKGGTAIAWSPSGKRLAAGHRGVALYEEDGTKLHYFDCHRGDPGDIAWLDDDRFVSGAADQDLVVIDASGQEVIERLVHHSASITSVDWDRDHEHLITAAHGGSVKISDVLGDPQPFTTLKHVRENRVHEISFSPDDQLMIAASDNQAAVWNFRTKELISKFAGNKPVWYANWIHQLKWRPDSQTVVGTCKAAQPVIWQRKSGEAFFPREETDFQPWAAAWSPAGKCLALSGDNRTDYGDNPASRGNETTGRRDGLTRRSLVFFASINPK